MGRVQFFSMTIVVALAGCTNTGSAQKKPVSEYPEAWALKECLDRRSRRFAFSEGTPLELGVIAASGCKQQRQKLAIAMSGGSRAFVLEFIRSGERTDATLAAERIVAIRAGR